LARFNLHHGMFGDQPWELAIADDVTITTQRLPDGIEVLRVAGPRLTLEILPFRGQQIWQAWVDGQPIGMRGMTAHPRAGQTILESLGAFVFHCGLLGIAAPGPDDDHPLHGELPLAKMDTAHLELDSTPGGTMVRIAGSFEYARAFRAHYLWSPEISFPAPGSTFEVTARIDNLMHSAMPFMYLAHPNFRPVNGSELVYSAPYGPEHVRVRTSVPAHLGDKPGYRAQLSEFQTNPSLHHRLTPDLSFDPEVVFEIDYIADDSGYAHSLQVHPDGQADWIAHRPVDCPRAIRWLSRTPEQDCIALAEPSTSGLTGYSEERRRGNVPELGPGARWETKFRLGRLDADAAAAMREKIDHLAGRIP
jgi:Domain of unknown function (DUF4432)